MPELSSLHPSASCSICGTTCAYYSFLIQEPHKDSVFNIELTGFTQHLTRKVSKDEFQYLQNIIDSLNTKLLYEFDIELAPYYCPQCNLNYCKDHWQRQITYDEGFYDAEIGICPKGHRRMLFD